MIHSNAYHFTNVCMQRHNWSWRYLIGVSGCLFLLGIFIFFHFFFAPFVKDRLINVFRNALQAELQLTASQEGFFFPKLLFRNISIKPLNHAQWHCSASTVECSFTIFHLLTYWNIPLIITLKGFDCFSIVDDQSIPFVDFCETIFRLDSDFFKPTLQALLMSDCSITLFDPVSDIRGTCSFNGDSISVVPESFELHGAMFFGIIGSTKRPNFISDLKGVVEGVFDKNFHKITIQMKGIFTDAAEPFSLRGHYADHAGRFSLSTAYPHCFIDPIICTKQVNKLSTKCSLSFLQTIFQIPINLDGMLSMQLQRDTDKKNSLQGILTLEGGSIFDLPCISSLKTNFVEKDMKLSGPMRARTMFGNFEGNYAFDFKTLSGQVTLDQEESIPVDSPFARHIFDHTKCKIRCLSNKDAIHLVASGELIYNLNQEKICWKISNNLIFSDGIFTKGFLGSHELYGLLLWKNLFQGQWNIVHNEQTMFSCILNQKESNHYCVESTCDGSFIRQLIQSSFDQYKVNIEGTCLFLGDYFEKKLTVDCAFFHGVCNIPFVRNSVIKAQGNAIIDFEKKEIIIPQVSALCTKGLLSSYDGHVYFNDTWSVDVCSIPVSCAMFDVSLHNIFDVLLSASLVWSKKKEEKTFFVSGDVLLHQGIVKNNLSFLYNNTKDSLFGWYTMEQGLHITSERPLRIDTEQLYTDIMLDISTSGSLLQPHLYGNIECIQGELLFPYQPLYISRGKLFFSGGTFQDATLELLAKNVVKNYAITMHAVGFLNDYTLLFDATPYLSQSQIFSLLLFGSDQETVSLFAPSLFSHNIKLGSFDIKFIPGFSDKSSRGGIRGALEIAVNKRLRATIQKNFTLSEDTRFELEYALTDVVTLRTIRDERRDVGGEVEFRWKF